HNFAGQYKGYLAMGLHIGIENFSGAMFSNVYRSKDAPRYIFGRTVYIPFPSVSHSVPLLFCVLLCCYVLRSRYNDR
ncbi:hypothetical protein SISSUDRAFT_993072, partial [Sistotremastrum suecicum HHB10207 ss-3]